jgi:acetyl esterase/lipase
MRSCFNPTAAAERTRRQFVPRPTDCLEERTLLSGISAISRGREPQATSIKGTVEVPGPSPTVPQLANVSFTTVGGRSQELDVYQPSGPAPAGGWPVMVAIHGGGWRRFDKSGFGARIASAFVPLGFAVVAPDYLLSTPSQPSWPVNFEDVQAAVIWVRSNSAALDINAERITAIGESAGANLAALLGAYSRSPSGTMSQSAVDAVIALSTPTALAPLYSQSPMAGRAVEQFLGGKPAQVPASYAAASPIDHIVPGDPPMLLVQGRRDSLIPASQSKAMATALARAGVPHRLILVNGGHDLDFPGRYAKLIPQMLEFLDAN